jgi:hypothetical protein
MWLMSSHTNWKTEICLKLKPVIADIAAETVSGFYLLHRAETSEHLFKTPSQVTNTINGCDTYREMTLEISILEMNEGNSNCEAKQRRCKVFPWSQGCCALLVWCIQSNCEVTLLFKGYETSCYYLSWMVGSIFTMIMHLFAQITLCVRFHEKQYSLIETVCCFPTTFSVPQTEQNNERKNKLWYGNNWNIMQ